MFETDKIAATSETANAFRISGEKKIVAARSDALKVTVSAGKIRLVRRT